MKNRAIASSKAAMEYNDSQMSPTTIHAEYVKVLRKRGLVVDCASAKSRQPDSDNDVMIASEVQWNKLRY